MSAGALVFLLLPESTIASAQSDADTAVRLSQMEEQMRQLRGQVEQLNYQVEQLHAQVAAGKTTGAVETQQLKKKKQASAQPLEKGIERIDDDVRYTEEPAAVVTQDGRQVQKAPGPKVLGTISGSALPAPTTQSSTLQGSTYDGQVLVPPAATEGQVVVPADSGTSLAPESVETVSLGPSDGNDDPEAMYERSYENLLRRQFGDAETGFRTFLNKHRDHSLAGNAQYWLGETYYVQGEYKDAAQAFLVGYRDFPKSRKAADSLLKLGLALTRLGQKQQACAAYGQVDTQFPKATEARKRAQSEAKRAGC